MVFEDALVPEARPLKVPGQTRPPEKTGANASKGASSCLLRQQTCKAGFSKAAAYLFDCMQRKSLSNVRVTVASVHRVPHLPGVSSAQKLCRTLAGSFRLYRTQRFPRENGIMIRVRTLIDQKIAVELHAQQPCPQPINNAFCSDVIACSNSTSKPPVATSQVCA